MNHYICYKASILYRILYQKAQMFLSQYIQNCCSGVELCQVDVGSPSDASSPYCYDGVCNISALLDGLRHVRNDHVQCGVDRLQRCLQFGIHGWANVKRLGF